MKRSSNYNTKQKELILEYIKKLNAEFTIKDIYNNLIDSVGLTTVYRLIEKLDKNGLLAKRTGKDGTTYYQYIEHCNHTNHFLLECEVCHHIIHIDCDCINGLTSHIKKNHGFKPNENKIIINGVCSNCSTKIRRL